MMAGYGMGQVRAKQQYLLLGVEPVHYLTSNSLDPSTAGKSYSRVTKCKVLVTCWAWLDGVYGIFLKTICCSHTGVILQPYLGLGSIAGKG